MLMQFTFSYDGKNARYEIQYKGAGTIQLVCVGERAMAELAKSNKISVKEELDIGNAIAEYLTSKNIASPKDNPIFILPEIDMGIVSNALAITPELLEICQKYLDEEAT